MLPAEIPFIAFNNHNLNYPDVLIKDIRGLQNYYKLKLPTPKRCVEP